MKKLMIIAVVAIVAASAFAISPPWMDSISVTIPVIMDIAPVAAIDLNGSQIKLELSNESTMGEIVYEGVADPKPQLTSNVSVDISATIAELFPTIVGTGFGSTPFEVALRNESYGATSGPIQYDPLVIGAGIGIEIAAAITNPDLTVRAQALGVPVAVVTLTVTPLP